MTAELFRHYAAEANLQVTSQRLIDWENEKWRWKTPGAGPSAPEGRPEQYSDCVTVFRKP
jgi:hypothetical protein